MHDDSKCLEEEPKYSHKRLLELWDKRSYRDLVLSAADPDGDLKLPRFVMQARLAMETRRLIWMTFAMALSTLAMAVATFVGTCYGR